MSALCAVALPPPSPALVLHEAAAKLRAAAEAALARQAADDRPPERWYADMDNALGGPVGEFCGLMSPAVALEIADDLDKIAVGAVGYANAGGTQEEIIHGHGYPICMARLILEAA